MAVVLAFGPAVARCEEAQVAVTLTSEKTEYLLGEPLRLALTVKNTGQ